MRESDLDELPVGFTGHQPDLDAGIINMRGQMYDPAAGRFNSVEESVGAASDGCSGGTCGTVLEAVKLMDCKNAKCRDPSPEDRAEPGAAAEAGAFGLYAFAGTLAAAGLVIALGAEAAGYYTALKISTANGGGAATVSLARCGSGGYSPDMVSQTAMILKPAEIGRIVRWSRGQLEAKVIVEMGEENSRARMFSGGLVEA